MSQATLPTSATAALLSARQLLQQLQAQAAIARQRHHWQQLGSVFLFISAVGLAWFPCFAQTAPQLLWLLPACRIGLVLVGLTLIALVGVSSRQPESQDWLTLAAGVAATERAIYLYRTVLPYLSDRGRWLYQQIASIQQQVQLTGEALSPEIDATVDDADLLAEGYLQQRLNPQLTQVEHQVRQLSGTRDLYQLIIWSCAGLGVLLPILSPNALSWGAIAGLLGVGLLLWLRLEALDRDLETQRQLTLGLTWLRDYWQILPLSEHTGATFFRLVVATEMLLESPYRQMSNQVQEAVASLRQDHPDLIQISLSQPVPLALEQALQGTTPPTIVEQLINSQDLSANAPTESEVSHEPTVEILPPAATSEPTPDPEPTVSTLTPLSTAQPVLAPDRSQRGLPHAFVVMPFGRKQAVDGSWIDFNSIYQTLIKPALEAAGFEPFRADEETSSGDILTDMFQELLLADLVVADLSIDNANVFYELGIRHALRRRGIVHIQAGRAYMPFDIFNVRTLPYHCDDSGCPDPQFLDQDQQALIKMLQATWTSDRHRIHSPIFNLLTGLLEPDRKVLRTPLAVGYWQEYTTLKARIEIAQRQKWIGDVVLLAEEVSNPLIKEDMIAEAGQALASVGNSAMALKQYRQGLKITPESLDFRCAEAFHLNRLGQADEAIVKLEQVLQEVPDCADATSKLARIYKDHWKQLWINVTDPAERIQIAYEQAALLQKSIANYLRGYRLDQSDYYPGINAFTLTALLDYLASTAEQENDDPEEAAYRQQLPALKGSVCFCLDNSLLKRPNDYWAALSLGDLAVCVAESPHQVAAAYRKALADLWNNKFALQTALDQLKLMELLNFRPEHVQAGIAVLQAEIDRFEQQEQLFARSEVAAKKAKPAQVFLFTGHMIDQPDRLKPRFPGAMESEAIRRIEQTLDKLGAYDQCIAIVPGIACGSDILFIEACLNRGMRVEAYLPFAPSDFISSSVRFAGDTWVDRFYTILKSPHITLHLQPERLGDVPVGDDPYRRNNRWALYCTLMYDISCIRLIALWNGQGGDGQGGTADMVNQVRQMGGIVEHIDLTKFDYWREHDNPDPQGYCQLEVLQ